ncbi:hypothetical protein ACET3Z_031304 [Daucus carota]
MRADFFIGLRRSSRLIDSPWLYNWAKKPPGYVDLEQGEEIVVVKVIDKRNEFEIVKNIEKSASGEDDAEFETPAECFSEGRTGRTKQRTKGGSLRQKSRTNSGKKLFCSGNRGSRSIIQISSTSGRRAHNRRVPVSRKQMLRTASQVKSPKNPVKRRREVGGGNTERVKVPMKRPYRKMAEQEGNGNGVNQVKVKKRRTYENYIQRKFSPGIMTDVLSSLSNEQRKWVSQTGFADILDFRMGVYTHNLGYNVVRAFDNENCSLHLQAGKIEINDRTVRCVLGFPMGDELIQRGKDLEPITYWGKQFEGAGCEVTAAMVNNLILESVEADRKFKLNFLVLMYNFFIEGQQNNSLNRDILKCSMDIDNCWRYNWCRLLLEKLRKAHAYRSAEPKRYFTRSLPFLIYLYVSKVCSDGTTYIAPTYPAYRGWSDRLVRERQKYEATNGSFGLGKLVDLKDKTEGKSDDVPEHNNFAIQGTGEGDTEMEAQGDCQNDNNILNEVDEQDNNASSDEVIVEDSLCMDEEVGNDLGVSPEAGVCAVSDTTRIFIVVDIPSL